MKNKFKTFEQLAKEIKILYKNSFYQRKDNIIYFNICSIDPSQHYVEYKEEDKKIIIKLYAKKEIENFSEALEEIKKTKKLFKKEKREAEEFRKKRYGFELYKNTIKFNNRFIPKKSILDLYLKRINFDLKFDIEGSYHKTVIILVFKDIDTINSTKLYYNKERFKSLKDWFCGDLIKIYGENNYVSTIK